MKKIKLTQGKFALVDDEDFEWLNQSKWCAMNNKHTFYAGRHRSGIMERMHRLIMEAKAGQMIDHVDHNGLNNQRQNIRFCTSLENARNKRVLITKYKAKYLGVFFFKRDKIWLALIRVNSKLQYLGRFKSQRAAALAYNKSASFHFGEFANLNKV